ncbi:hypothetical protein M426DRAFT_322228 [Hypoxylon sp. CI-4A]|nr:hypothetical protein M426DRAFT_322228 [Hypoxylon sp. CI-4A]
MFAVSKTKVKTRLPTRPFPANAERKPIRTERLIISPFSEDDLDGLHSLRTQPEVMDVTAQARIDADKEETRVFRDRFLPPHDIETYNTVIRLASTGEFIGLGGLVREQSVWPEVGYIFKREYWGQGYATEFLTAWVNQWWTLPRSDAEVEVDESTVDGSGQSPELLVAFINETNLGSRGVLEKVGFREFNRWTLPDHREGRSGDVPWVGLRISSGNQRS